MRIGVRNGQYIIVDVEPLFVNQLVHECEHVGFVHEECFDWVTGNLFHMCATQRARIVFLCPFLKTFFAKHMIAYGTNRPLVVGGFVTNATIDGVLVRWWSGPH